MNERSDARLTRPPSTSAAIGSTTQGTSRYRTVRGNTTTTRIVASILLWRRLRGIVQGALGRVRETVTAAGWLLILSAIVGCGVGFGLGWMEFAVAGLVAAVLLACSALFLLGANAYDVRFTLERERVVAGQDVRGTVDVRNGGRRTALPGRVDLPIGEGLVEFPVPLLRPGAQHAEELLLPARRRGVVTVGPARIVRGDPLGILRRERNWDELHTLFIHPRTLHLPSMSTGFLRDLEGQPSARIVTDDLSFHAIREYMPGDSRRHVHWKSTAKTGTLMVRQYEESRRSQVIVVLATGTDGFRDAEEFELAVSAAGSVALRGMRDGRDVHVAVGDELPEFATSTVRSVRTLQTRTGRVLLDELAGVEQHEHVNALNAIAEDAVAQRPDVSLAFLVCGSALTASQLRVAARAFPRDIAVVAVVCDLHAEPSIRTLGDVTVISVGLLDDLRHLLTGGGSS